jgi:radical SAM superfamily enzyme YgiQ (UPF0313 family)
MKNYKKNASPGKELVRQEKILLILLPFWSSLIPPIGIASLKSFLKQHNYDVKTIDVNVEADFKDFYDTYFDILRENVPGNKKGNFFSIGHDVLRNQMMAYLNYKDETEYLELVKVLIRKTFYVDVDIQEVLKLNRIIEGFYIRLREYLLNLLGKEKPTVLGLSVYSDTLPASMFAFKLTRETYPHIKTVMGGGIFADQLAGGSKNMEIFLKKTEDYIDKIIIGEGEILFLKLLRNELPGSKRVYKLDDINWEILNLSSADVLDMSDFDLRSYPYIVSYTSRSCPFQCSFCSETIQWGKFRRKTGRQVHEELIKLYKRHGSQLFLLSDSLLNPVIGELSDAFLKSDISLYWEGWLRVDKRVCDIENTWRWRRSGFYHARLGIESGSPHVQELMGKKLALPQIKGAISALASIGIKTTTLWVIGHPGETEADFRQTLDLVEELRKDIYEAECRPFYFYPTGQVNSDSDWWGKMRKIPLYPGSAEDILLFQTWLLDCEPSREVAYQRMNRFVEHCKKLGIPNPYSIHDIFQADERWKKIHKNAVPSLVDFKNSGKYIEESKHVEKLNLVQPSIRGKDEEYQEYLDFGF